MGRYDNISEDRLRRDLVSFAQLILRLDEEDGVLASPADLQRILGDLRQKLFAYEVRRMADAATDPQGTDSNPVVGGPPEDTTLRESLRVVREARQRNEAMQDEWSPRPPKEKGSDE